MRSPSVLRRSMSAIVLLLIALGVLLTVADDSNAQRSRKRGRSVRRPSTFSRYYRDRDRDDKDDDDKDDDDDKKGRKDKDDKGKKGKKDDDDDKDDKKKDDKKKKDDDEEPAPPEEEEEEEEEEHSAPGPLDSIPVPTPPNLDDFIVDKQKAIILGKALFWDMQVGSDGNVACATCHWHAGADARTRNTVAPGRDLFGKVQRFFDTNDDLKADDFPFHRLADPDKPRSSDNPVVHDTSEIVGSQGVVKKDFIKIVEGSPVDRGKLVPDPVFNIDGVNARQVTGRNSPTTINAVFNDRNFWDGRANRFFNGVNPFGDMDRKARVWKVSEKDLKKKKRKMKQVRILLDNSSLASQAVGPPLSEVEMSWNGRMFPELGRKMLSLRPLAKQEVHPEDSVLNDLLHPSGKGLCTSYAQLICDAFHPSWWKGSGTTKGGYTHMEANFSLFWGLAIQMYESTLVSDQTPFDAFAKGDEDALSDKAKRGLKLFLDEGKCINCHGGPEFAGATVSDLRGVLSPEPDPIELMLMQRGPEAFYDNGFYNIGVRPTNEDLGVGGRHPKFGPFALSRRVQEGQKPHKLGQKVKIGKNDRLAVDGAFKTPTLRNIELTGPYMHNGGMRTLTEVVQFYARRADFFKENIKDLDPDVDGISEIRGDDEKIAELVEFLKHLTDERVRYSRAPFDHPELIIANGHKGVEGGVAVDNNMVLPAVGRNGGNEVLPFDEIVD